jgi:hypothetical protein
MTESFRIAAKSREPLAANQQKRGPETRPLKRSTKQDGRTAIEKKQTRTTGVRKLPGDGASADELLRASNQRPTHGFRMSVREGGYRSRYRRTQSLWATITLSFLQTRCLARKRGRLPLPSETLVDPASPILDA